MSRSRRKLYEQDRGIYSQVKDAKPKDFEEEVEETVGTDIPLDASPLMAVQLAVDLPPVEDDDYYPVSSKELGNAAQAISELVPDSEVEWFYKQLHKLLDKSVDRAALGEEEELVDEEEKIEKEGEQEMKEESVKKIIKKMLFEMLSDEDKDELDQYRGADSVVDYFGEDPPPESIPSTDEVSLEDLAAEFGYSGAPGIRQELNRLTDRMEYFATTVSREDLNALTQFAVGEYIDTLEGMDILDEEDVADLRVAPQIVKDLDSFRFFFVSAFILPAYKEVSREANKRIKAEIADLGIPKELQQTLLNQATGAAKRDSGIIRKKLLNLVKKNQLSADELDAMEEKIRTSMSVLSSMSELSDDVVERSLNKWQGMSQKKRESLIDKAMQQTGAHQQG